MPMSFVNAPLRLIRSLGGALGRRPEGLLAIIGLFWLLTANWGFLGHAALGSGLEGWPLLRFVGLLAVSVFALHWLLLLLLAHRWTMRALFWVLLPLAAVTSHYIDTYGVRIDPSMIRNVLRTELAEAGELLGVSFVTQLLLLGLLPAWILSRVPLTARPVRQALMVRAACLGAGLALLAGSIIANMQPLSSFTRNDRDARYLITPANALWSLSVAVRGDVVQAATPIKPIGLDAQPGPIAEKRERPLRIVLVVGETVRAANWGLSGYARDTTPGLAQRHVINFSEATSCGTNTEVSLPCMFAPVGRRAYDESRTRSSESLLHVLARAGVDVLWRDNQSGCKGVCRGLPYEQVGSSEPGRCSGGRCLDDLLLAGLGPILDRPATTSLTVLHMLGNHGPSYFRRYPGDFAVFKPECRHDELSRCAREEIVNAYDNAVRYTDHLLSRLIDELQSRSDRQDSVMIYLSDHGESLGEKGLFLHGMPWAIAPLEQTRVPWVIWFSPGAGGRLGIDPACLAQRATRPVQHDHLFHTLLSLADVRTSLHDRDWDLTAACRIDG
jgi:lipid A ethanolaminephosphotransferase